ncbi:hypothetical protein H257_19057 [Aphanomyces astaci]|uniref:Uncharacterized protein n=1 Tax=Aphanomyces astaci TaxID=112090 RepID=W4FBB9_APHAT|nr:hypothetical protein H257_19057 [Aphanomyces astaci]ETV64008.1 hypothetical protein H257_19057 [Aphanomyces astaci]|eukprot:XP_009846508.1 hypothetical protein H257_19057 [Aphanomyces astaci]
MSNWLKFWGLQITLSIADHKTVRHPKAPEAAAADTSRALKRPGLSGGNEHRTKATIPLGRMAGIKAPMLNTMYSYLHDNWTLNDLCV